MSPGHLGGVTQDMGLITMLREKKVEEEFAVVP